MATTESSKQYPEKFITHAGDGYWEGEDFGVEVTPQKSTESSKTQAEPAEKKQ